jgi:hypothetical protein
MASGFFALTNLLLFGTYVGILRRCFQREPGDSEKRRGTYKGAQARRAFAEHGETAAGQRFAVVGAEMGWVTWSIWVVTAAGIVLP